MDLEIHEALALSADRSDALSQLLPGSEDHDYYACLHAQHAGKLDDADAILARWPDRHGHTSRYDRLRLRQLLYRITRDPNHGSVADNVRDWFGVSHWHEAEVEDTAPGRPTRLAPGTFSGEALLREAAEQDANLSQVTDEGLYELIARRDPLDQARRRSLLSRLGHTPQPELVDLVADELGTRGSSGFGSLAAHHQLTLAQLHALAERRSELRGHLAWVGAVILRMQPPAAVDLETDRETRTTYLTALWEFLADLPAAINTLKAHVLWHLLDTLRRRPASGPGDVEIDPALVRAYLSLPRNTNYVARRWLEGIEREQIAVVGQDFRSVTGLPPAGDDEELVRDLLTRALARGVASAEQYAKWIDRSWLDTEIATATLLSGGAGNDRATLTLGPARAQALRERIELAWCVHDPVRLGPDDPVALDVDVKNVPQLVVKVFRIDPLAYFQHQRREVDTDLDLDGLAASHEFTIDIAEPPIRRVRRRIELPMCAKPGTYIIDLIGNGMSSRALIEKGRLRHVVRIGAAGHVVTVIDEAGVPRTGADGARAWIGEREYVPDERGRFVVPFSTAPTRTPMLLSCGGVASVRHLSLERETYRLDARIALDRQGLATNRKARAIARVSLSCAGQPASLSLLRETRWDVTLTDHSNVSTTKSHTLELDDAGAAVLEWPIGEDISQIDIAVTGTVDVKSEQREEQVRDVRHWALATIHDSPFIEALYLAQTDAGWVVSALGKSGEPRAHRPITVSLVHRWTRRQLNVELATDERGRVELGELPGIEQIAATLGGLTQQWRVGGSRTHGIVAVPAGREVIVPVPEGTTSAEVVRRMSLIETPAAGAAAVRRAAPTPAPIRHVDVEPESTEGALVLRGLPVGDYELRGPGVRFAIAIVPEGPEVAGRVVTPAEMLEVPRQVPAIAVIETANQALAIRLRGVGPNTRVHAIATPFVSSLVDPVSRGPRNYARRHADRVRGVRYVSGRELGDEYRYVLERRDRKRHPNLLLDKPGLLLNPWSRRTTTTDVAHARAGSAFGAAPAPMARPAPQSVSGYGGRADGAPVTGPEFASYDFLPDEPVVLADLVPDGDTVSIPLADLGGATTVTLIVDDPAGTSLRRSHLSETPLAPRDLRLQNALAPGRHASQRKEIVPLPTGAQLAIADLATAKVHLIDTVERAHAYLLALAGSDDAIAAPLRELAFVTRWHALPDGERRELYSKHACHELHLFLYYKDRAFFDAVVRPYLANKRVKTFVDHWLLDADLAPYLEPAELAERNAFELALLAMRLPPDDRLARVLGDRVSILPPDPTGDTRLIDALLGASTLDESELQGLIGAAADEARAASELDMTTLVATAGPTGGMMPGEPPAALMASRRAAPRKKSGRRSREVAKSELADDFADELLADAELREEAAPHFRAADKTQEWAEHNWWHRTPQDSDASMIEANRLWRDLAGHRDGPFLSRGLGLATRSFAEAMCALAVTDLPFVASKHAYDTDGPRLAITASSNALAGSSQIVDGELVTGGVPLVVGTSYVRTDDRYEWESGEQREKYIDGAFAVGIAYTCQVVIANPTSSRQRVAALIQIPRGSVPVGRSSVTTTIDIAIEPYGTHGHEYTFYFPAPGTWTHFPVHVTREGAIVAAAPGRTLDVTAGGGATDPTSWPHVSQRGDLAAVTSYLESKNLAAIDLSRVAWRMRDRHAYAAILDVLDRRHVYDRALWGYALLHRDAPRIRTFLRALAEQLLEAGPVLEILERDAEDLGRYEHLELAPLINARAHRLGPKLRILNDGLSAQYNRFLDLVAHRPQPTAEDLLAAAHYLLAQDRVDDAIAMLARVDVERIADRMQHDYLAAYLACITGDLARARQLATRWREHPVDRWRHTFAALVAMLDELDNAGAPEIVDPKSRDQQHADLAARQPTFDLEVDREGITLRGQHVASLELRLFWMDVELLFSRQPFVQSDVTRFSFIEPGHREVVRDLVDDVDRRLPWPAALRGKNVVVEAVGAGSRKAKIHYANDLATTLANHVGRVRVQRLSDRNALAATYVKVYARKHGGNVEFYKDGYTDLRGWFDYASLSTTDLDDVERFAILVCSDTAGASILETAPPVR